MNHPLHLALLLTLPSLTLGVESSNPCPAGHTGRVPTANCIGYADCVNGKASATYLCTAGTLFDAKSGICNWPSSVNCEIEAEPEELDDDDDYIDDYVDEREVDGKDVVPRFCPPGYTGKAPTTKCSGYVICTDGEEGLSSKCPTDSLFNSMTLRCEYGFNDCELLVSESLQKNKLKQYAKFCPDDYTGKAPIEGCGGYVKCRDGDITDALECPQGTMFDVMKLACTYADVDCGAYDEPEEEEEEEEEEETEKQPEKVNHAKYCPEDYTGRAPTKDCDGYIDCRNGKVKLVKDCPAGTKFDIMILACTFSEVQCEATYEATDYPTPSPVRAKADKEERVVVDETCPPGYTGNKAIAGCTGYIYCAAGLQLGEFKCASGTLFDVKLGFCSWSSGVDTSLPECSTSSPSYMPTLSPIYPTVSPSYSPTILDLTGALFYPDYKNGVCKNDDNYPSSLSNIYLKSSAHGCCTAFFDSRYDTCMQSFTSESPSSAPSGERFWYPDYDFNICRSDQEYSSFETNFFATYENCCKFDFIDEAECLMKKPSAMGLIYYPHYPSGICKNDGRQSLDEVWLYTSKKDCCKNEMVQPYSACMKNEGNGEMEQNSSGITTTTTTTTPASDEYYPDYNNDICRNDGNVPEFEINIFSTYEACCQFSWMDTKKCLSNKPIPDSDKWYPIVSKGYCVNNGSPPNKVALSDTSNECCKKFFSSSKRSCIDQSNKRWYPDYNKAHCKNDGNEPEGILMSESYEMCCDRFMSSSKTQCYSYSENFSNNAPPPTASPTKKPVTPKTQKPTKLPTQKPNQSIVTDTCETLTQKKCNKDNSCKWHNGACTSVHIQTKSPTNKPTAKPTAKPSSQSIIEASSCESLRSKRQCSNDDTCRWDSTFDNCVSLTGPPAIGCQSLNKKKCSRDASCGWNDTFNICTKVFLTETTSTTSTTTTTESPPTKKPTRKPRPEPTMKPTRKPSHQPTDSPIQQIVTCESFTKKRFCTSNESCRWDDASKKCITASSVVEETNSPTYYPTFSPTSNDDDSMTEMWYPIISQSRCVLLPSSSPGNDPYDTYVECCNNPWIDDRNSCVDNAKKQLDPDPPVENQFYPDYFKGSCQNDGNQPASEQNLYDVLDDCCKNEWLDYSRCMQISSDEPPSNSGSNENQYYPDYFFNVCRNDGKQPAEETFLFDNVEDCCGLEYMEYDGCVYLSN